MCDYPKVFSKKKFTVQISNGWMVLILCTSIWSTLFNSIIAISINGCIRDTTLSVWTRRINHSVGFLFREAVSIFVKLMTLYAKKSFLVVWNPSILRLMRRQDIYWFFVVYPRGNSVKILTYTGSNVSFFWTRTLCYEIQTTFLALMFPLFRKGGWRRRISDSKF